MLIIPIKNNELERALKNFKLKVQRTKLVKELQERKEYKKKSDLNRQTFKNAVYKSKKNTEL